MNHTPAIIALSEELGRKAHRASEVRGMKTESHIELEMNKGRLHNIEMDMKSIANSMAFLEEDERR